MFGLMPFFVLEAITEFNSTVSIRLLFIVEEAVTQCISTSEAVTQCISTSEAVTLCLGGCKYTVFTA